MKRQADIRWANERASVVQGYAAKMHASQRHSQGSIVFLASELIHPSKHHQNMLAPEQQVEKGPRRGSGSHEPRCDGDTIQLELAVKKSGIA